jgi:hypothetical protein
MKKTILFFLLIAGTGNLLHAQLRDLPIRSESIFDNPAPGNANAQFNFYLPGNKRILLEFSHISQVEQMPDLDSLVRIATAMLSPLKDSLKADGMVRRVDIVLTNAIPKIRIISHPEYSNTYTVKDKELMQLKVNDDTIRIIGMSKSRVMWNVVDVNGNKTLQNMMGTFAITIILNNVEDISTIEPDALATCIALLKPNVERFYRRDGPNSPGYQYRASFNMRTGKMFSPFNVSYIPVDHLTGKTGFNGVLGFSLTAVRGSVVPSMQAGIAYTHANNYFSNSFRLYLEAQYFFSRDADNKLTTDQNTFGVFQLMQTTKRSIGNALSFEGNISLGYLLSRKGNWYETNTWRIGLPVLKNKHISIEPQFVFDGWFKHISPAIKFTFNF